MPTTYSIKGPFLQVFRDGDDMDFHDLRVNAKFTDVDETVTITLGQSGKKFEIPYASFYPALSGTGAFTTLLTAQMGLTVMSGSWGYDSASGDSVFIKTASDGTVSYESPIGSVYNPSGTILPIDTFPQSNSVVSYTSSGVGNTSSCNELIVVNQDGGVCYFNGQLLPAVAGYTLNFPAKVLGNGNMYIYPNFSFDCSGGGNITIHEIHH